LSSGFTKSTKKSSNTYGIFRTGDAPHLNIRQVEHFDWKKKQIIGDDIIGLYTN
jgi:hypothetical protein